jgi:hypothetical protein
MALDEQAASTSPLWGFGWPLGFLFGQISQEGQFDGGVIR